MREFWRGVEVRSRREPEDLAPGRKYDDRICDFAPIGFANDARHRARFQFLVDPARDVVKREIVLIVSKEDMRPRIGQEGLRPFGSV